jgi:hypothetical protein
MTRAFLPPLSHNLGQYLDAIHLSLDPPIRECGGLFPDVVRA